MQYTSIIRLVQITPKLHLNNGNLSRHIIHACTGLYILSKHGSVEQSHNYSNCKDISSLIRVTMHDMPCETTLPRKVPITVSTLEWFLTSVGLLNVPFKNLVRKFLITVPTLE